jgi:hypothetical protein
MIVRTCRIDGRKPAIQLEKEPAIMIREPDATRQPAPHDIQLMSKHRVLSFKPHLRLERRGQDGQSETEQPDHSASLGDSITASTRIRFSVHTGCAASPWGRSRIPRIGPVGRANVVIDGAARGSSTVPSRRLPENPLLPLFCPDKRLVGVASHARYERQLWYIRSRVFRLTRLQPLEFP